MSARGVTILRRGLKNIVKQNSIPSHKCLKGAVTERSVVLKKCHNYLAMLRLANPGIKPIPPELISIVGQLRKTMNDVRLKAIVRIQAAERLMLLAGYGVERHYEQIDELICREMGWASNSKPETTTVAKVRMDARSKAYADVVACFKSDRANGLIRTLDDAEQGLRLPEMPAPVVPTQDDGEQLLAKFNQLFGNRVNTIQRR
jgi:hypothetical protein